MADTKAADTKAADTKAADTKKKDEPKSKSQKRKKSRIKKHGKPRRIRIGKAAARARKVKVFKKQAKRKATPKKYNFKRPKHIPESALKSRQFMYKNRQWHNNLHQQWYGKLKNWRVQYYRRAKKHAEKHERVIKHDIRMKRIAKRKFNYYIPPEGRVLVVVRIRGINAMHPMTRKILQLLRLRQINNAVFVRVNKATLNMLKKVEPYVTYGVPTRKTIAHLIYKRGYVRFNHQRTPINDNFVLSKRLLKHGIICVEDLIDTILNVRKSFKVANSYLWPFKLRAPTGGYKGKGKHFTEGGSAGNRHDEINKLIRRML